MSSWGSRWAGSALHQYDIEDMFWRWSGRFPSLAELDRDEFWGEPFWCVTREAGLLAADAPA